MDFETELYEPLRASRLDDEHTLVLPHEDSEEPFDSQRFLREECDRFVADVSAPSLGLGIELGWGNEFDVPILCVHKVGVDPSSALQAVTIDDVRPYDGPDELVSEIQEWIA